MSTYRHTKKHIPEMLAQHGPQTRSRLCYLIGVTQQACSSAVQQLLAEGTIVDLGAASDYGMQHIRRDARIFGLPGQKLAPRLGDAAPKGPTGEHWYQPEWRELRDDLYSHRDLAMLTRRR